MPHERYMHTSLGEVVSWRADLRALGVERRAPPSNQTAELPPPDKPPPSSVPRTPPHSRKPGEPEVLRRVVTPITPPPPPPGSALHTMLEHQKTAPLPLPESAEPTKSAEQTLVKLERPAAPEEPPSKRKYQRWSDETKAQAVELARKGEMMQKEIAQALGTTQGSISKWIADAEIAEARAKEREREIEMPSKATKKGKSGERNRWNPYPQEYKDKWVKRALNHGKGGVMLAARESKHPVNTISAWIREYKERQEAPSRPTMVSSGPVSSPKSKVTHSKPNGQLTGFLQGLDEYIEKIVDARVEQKLVEILRTKSLLELMKQ